MNSIHRDRYHQSRRSSPSLELFVDAAPLDVMFRDQEAVVVVISLRSCEPLLAKATTLQFVEERTASLIEDLMLDWGIPRLIELNARYFERTRIVAWLTSAGINCILSAVSCEASEERFLASRPFIRLARAEALLRTRHEPLLRKAR